jgi:hypothetical protein
VAFAPSTLTLAELQHALAVEPGADELDFDNITAPEVILSACAGLITVRQGNRARELTDFVYLVHQTTRRYIVRNINRW